MNDSKWHWPLPYNEPNTLNIFLDEWLGINPTISIERRFEFIEYLSHSFSLSFDEKQTIIKIYTTLSEFQIEELIKVFIEEAGTLDDLQNKMPRDVAKLQLHNLCKWALLLNERQGARIFLAKHIFSDAYSSEDILLSASFICHELQMHDNNKELILFIETVLDKIRKPKLKHTSIYSELINFASLALVSDEQCQTLNALLNHNIKKKMDVLFEIKSKNRKIIRENKRKYAFNKICFHTYLYGKYGFDEDLFSAQISRRVFRLYIDSGAPADLASWFRYYYICRNNLKLARKAAKISVNKNFNKKNNVFDEHIVKLVSKQSITDLEWRNTLRNVWRHFIILPMQGEEALNIKNNVFSVFLDELYQIPTYGNNYKGKSLFEIIGMSFVMGDMRLMAKQNIIDYIQSKADSEPSFLLFYKLAYSGFFSENLYTDFETALVTLESKGNMLDFTLSVKYVMLKKTQFLDEKKQIADRLTQIYLSSLAKKKFHVDKEEEIVNAIW